MSVATVLALPRVLVLCPGAWDIQAFGCRFDRRYELLYEGQRLVETHSMWELLYFDIFRWVDRTVRAFSGMGLAGIVGTGDYPGCILASLVGERLGLRVPRPEVVVRLSHKYYSRQLQEQFVPEAVPAFEVFDPSAGTPPPRQLGFPFFVKPVKGTMSIRAQEVRGEDELRRALQFSLRERLAKYFILKPYQNLLQCYTEGDVSAWHFIGEALLCGVQVTVDGFVEDGKAVVMGIADSVMYPGTISFQRFDLPSQLPEAVQARMRDIATRLMEGVGFEHACFNIEMFYDPDKDRISVIEVNPRMSYQFADLYERVTGTNTYDVQLALAAGVPVQFVAGRGRDGAAASFVMRRFENARVLQVPSAQDIAKVTERFPGTIVQILCAPGDRLSRHNQDVGSYRYCIVNMGAPTREELFANYALVERLLPFTFA